MVALHHALFSRAVTLTVASVICFLALAQPSSIPRLQEHGRMVREPFLVQGCHAPSCDHHSPPLRVLPINNYDMGPSIARSDSFDIVHYDLMLDVTDYYGQSLVALATIDFTVLLGGGATIWWDLQGLVVDSVQWNGAATSFQQWGPKLHIDAPAPMEANESITLQIWYGGQPNDDPYWGGVYYASDLIYNLGIGLTLSLIHI